MDKDKVCEIVKQLVALREELKQKQDMLEELRDELKKAMNGEPQASTPYGDVKLYAYDVKRLDKSKIENLVEKSQFNPITNLDMVDLTNISDLHYYKVFPRIEE